MKTFTLSIVMICFSQLSYGQADVWYQVVSDGFGIPAQNTVPEMEFFEGYLYTSTAPIGPGLAKLYRSSSGDIGTWTNVTPPLSGDKSIHSFGITDLDSGYIWCGTGNPTTGAMIYRSRNGTSWIPIAVRGFGDQGLSTAAPHMVVFQGSSDTIPYLYAGVGSHGGGIPGQVWRIPFSDSIPSDWVRLIDFDTVTTSVNDTVDLISYFCLWKNKIYFGTNAKGQLWESSDGVNFTRNMGVGYGFDSLSTNIVISSIEVFNDTMYATTTNMQGGQLWRSGDGVNWQMITDDAFGKGNAVNELRSLRTSFGKIWLTGYTDINYSNGTPVWRSDNGSQFIQSNIDGFGDINNNGQNAITIGFGNYQYFGGPNYQSGGQVWRADMSTKIDETNKDDCSVCIYPNPFPGSEYIYIESECYTINDLSIYDITGKLITAITSSSDNQFRIGKGTLKAGLYFYSFYTDDGILRSGKLIVN